MIRGWCIGGGLGIAAGCDLRFATEGSKFGVPAGRLGLGYAHSGVQTLMNIVGPAYTKEIFYTARHFTAAEAMGMGFVNRVVPEAEFDEFVAGQLATIAANAPLTLARAEGHGEGAAARPATPTSPSATQMVAECFASEDYKEGRRAFMEKRPAGCSRAGSGATQVALHLPPASGERIRSTKPRQPAWRRRPRCAAATSSPGSPPRRRSARRRPVRAGRPAADHLPRTSR